MKFSPKAAATALLLVLVACGGGDLKSRSKDALSDMISALEGIKDKESAEAAVSDLKAAIAEMKAIKKESAELSAEEKAALQKDADADGEEMASKMLAEMTRVMSIPGVQEVITPVMDDMGK